MMKSILILHVQAAAADQPGPLEHAQVLRDGGAADPERRRQLLHRRGAVREAHQDGAPRGVGEGGEGGAQGVAGGAHVVARHCK